MQKHDDSSKKTTFFTPKLFIFSIIGISIPILLSLFASFLVNIEKFSAASILPLSYAFVFIGMFLSAFLSAKKFGKPIVTALIQSTVCCILFYIIGAILFGRIVPTESSWQILLSSFSGGILGAVFSTFFVEKKRRKSFNLTNKLQ